MDGHCVKSVRIQSYSGPHFSRMFPHLDIFPYSVLIRENVGKMRTRITLHTDLFYAVVCLH